MVEILCFPPGDEKVFQMTALILTESRASGFSHWECSALKSPEKGGGTAAACRGENGARNEKTDGHFLSDSKESSAKAIRLFQQEREKLQGNRGARAEAVSASIRASKMHLHFYDSENSFAPYASSPNLSPILYGLTQYYRIHLSLFCQNVLFLPNSRLEYLTKGSEIFKEKTPLQSLWCESDKRLFRSFSSSLCLYLFGRRPKRQCNGSSGR